MDSLFDILELRRAQDRRNDSLTDNYLTRLSTLSLSDLTNNEPASLSQSAQSHVRNLQALSKRSHKAVITSSSHLENLETIVPSLVTKSQELKENLPALESAASDFASKYERNTENAVLDRRKRALLLSRNAERVCDVLDLPGLLATSVTTAQSVGASSTASAAASYSAALDLSANVKRLSILYPRSSIVSEISKQAEGEVQNLRTILITTLQTPTLKLTAAMRTIGWLRRVAPELTVDEQRYGKPEGLSSDQHSSDGGLAVLFLLCRLRTLHQTLDALEPLRDLADQETAQRTRSTKSQGRVESSAGGQSERYLKRYIEIFREQSFNIISMYRSIFPNGLPDATMKILSEPTDDLFPLPSPIVSFATHLVELLGTTLKQYIPNVVDKSARESLLTQILYCAGSLGRLGAEFGMLIALLEEQLSAVHGIEQDPRLAEPEWAQVMNKHRIQASRLELLARGVGTSRKVSGDIPAMSPTLA